MQLFRLCQKWKEAKIGAYALIKEWLHVTCKTKKIKFACCFFVSGSYRHHLNIDIDGPSWHTTRNVDGQCLFFVCCQFNITVVTNCIDYHMTKDCWYSYWSTLTKGQVLAYCVAEAEADSGQRHLYLRTPSPPVWCVTWRLIDCYSHVVWSSVAGRLWWLGR